MTYWPISSPSVFAATKNTNPERTPVSHDGTDEASQDGRDGVSEAETESTNETDDTEATEGDEDPTAESFELPGADLSGLSGEDLTVKVVPKQADEFTCSVCFLVHHRTRLAEEAGSQRVCLDCA